MANRTNKMKLLLIFMVHLLFVDALRNFDIDSFIDGAFALVVYHTDLSHFRGILHVRAAIGLQIESDDFNCANLLDSFWQKIDLGADQVRNLKRFRARQDFNAHIVSGLDLAIDRRSDDVYQLLLQSLELKVHAALERFHISASDLRAIIAEHTSAQDVHGSMRPHQSITPI